MKQILFKEGLDQCPMWNFHLTHLWSENKSIPECQNKFPFCQVCDVQSGLCHFLHDVYYDLPGSPGKILGVMKLSC